MTLRLTLIRHAKSSWDDPLLSDHDRPLNKRGYAAAERIGAWLGENGYCAETVYSSTARRAAETWAGISPYCTPDIDAGLFSSLYHASPERMLAMLHRTKTKTAMMIGHNPGIAMLAEALVKTAPNHPKFFHYPSAATSVIRFDVENWSDIRSKTGGIVDFIVPRDL
jgi:phosphohistidine phosphatase